MTDYAPLYTTREKFKIIGLQLGWVLPVILFFKYMFLPWLNSTNWFLCSTHGLEISIFGIFIGIPLLLVITTLFNIKQMYLILKLGQYPLPNQKTYTLTSYKYGLKAKWISYFYFFLLLPFLIAFCIWGGYAANKMLNGFDQSKLNIERQKICR